MNDSAYRIILLGTLLVIFNIQVGPIVIFPDVIGFLVMTKGISMLLKVHNHEALRKARQLSWCMILIDIISYFIGGQDVKAIIGSQGLGIILGCMHLAMRYFILEAEKASIEVEGEQKSLGKKQMIYLMLHTLSLIGLSFRWNMPSISVMVIILVVSYEIYWLCIIVGLEQQVRKRRRNFCE